MKNIIKISILALILVFTINTTFADEIKCKVLWNWWYKNSYISNNYDFFKYENSNYYKNWVLLKEWINPLKWLKEWKEKYEWYWDKILSDWETYFNYITETLIYKDWKTEKLKNVEWFSNYWKSYVYTKTDKDNYVESIVMKNYETKKIIFEYKVKDKVKYNKSYVSKLTFSWDWKHALFVIPIDWKFYIINNWKKTTKSYNNLYDIYEIKYSYSWDSYILKFSTFKYENQIWFFWEKIRKRVPIFKLIKDWEELKANNWWKLWLWNYWFSDISNNYFYIETFSSWIWKYENSIIYINWKEVKDYYFENFVYYSSENPFTEEDKNLRKNIFFKKSDKYLYIWKNKKTNKLELMDTWKIIETPSTFTISNNWEKIAKYVFEDWIYENWKLIFDKDFETKRNLWIWYDNNNDLRYIFKTKYSYIVWKNSNYNVISLAESPIILRWWELILTEKKDWNNLNILINNKVIYTIKNTEVVNIEIDFEGWAHSDAKWLFWLQLWDKMWTYKNFHCEIINKEPINKVNKNNDQSIKNQKLNKTLNKLFNKIDKKSNTEALEIYKKIISRIDKVLNTTNNKNKIETLNYLKFKIEEKIK